jgi:hypothetical protein
VSVQIYGWIAKLLLRAFAHLSTFFGALAFFWAGAAAVSAFFRGRRRSTQVRNESQRAGAESEERNREDIWFFHNMGGLVSGDSISRPWLDVSNAAALDLRP